MLLQADALGLFSESWSDQEFWVEVMANVRTFLLQRPFSNPQLEWKVRLRFCKTLKFWSWTGTFPFIIYLMQKWSLFKCIFLLEKYILRTLFCFHRTLWKWETYLNHFQGKVLVLTNCLLQYTSLKQTKTNKQKTNKTPHLLFWLGTGTNVLCVEFLWKFTKVMGIVSGLKMLNLELVVFGRVCDHFSSFD